MQQIRKIQTLESLRNQPFVAPAPLVDWAEELDEVGRPWLAMWAAPEGADPKSWMLLDTETQEGRLFLEDGDEVYQGLWWPGLQRFHTAEGSWVDLMGVFHPFGEDDPSEHLDEEDADDEGLADDDVEVPLI